MKYIIDKLKQYNIPLTEIERYNETHRYWHNLDHIKDMINKAITRNILTDELFLAIFFHDIVYNPKLNNNEELSVELLTKYVDNCDDIKLAILDTKNHEPKSKLSKQLCDLDLSVLYGDYKDFIDFENKIFKEYQFVNYNDYKLKRLEILSDFGINPEWLNYVKYRKPKIGIYAGSFNPFHKGHYNILQKAENIFDKVIIARGLNPEKNNIIKNLPSIISNRQVELYEGLLTDFIDEMSVINSDCDFTLVRGLRNSNDLDYELVQYRFLQDLKPNIKMISLICDKEYEHISSSAIRSLEKFNKETNYLI